MKFDNDSLKDLKKQIEQVLDTFGSNEGIEFEIGKITYTDGYANISLKAYSVHENVGPGNLCTSGKQLEFLNNSAKVGARSDWYNKKVIINGKDYLVTGINTRARKFPIILTGIDGSSVKATLETVRRDII